jgi:hypothetical protein
MFLLKRLSVLFLFLLGFVSCEKEINIDLSEKEKQIVVEGVIETGQQPYVTIANSIGFFDKIDLSNVQYVKGAIVSVKDLTSNETVILKEYTIDTVIGARVFSFTIYGPDITDPVAMNFKGMVDHSYALNILSDGKNYSAVTKIPTGNGLDSLWMEPVLGKEDSFSTLRAVYIDPDTFGNAVRVQTLTKHMVKNGDPEIYLTGFNQVYNDDIINGVRLPLTIDIGYDKSKNYTGEESANLGYVRRGDTVTVKWSPIDKKVFTFWETLSFSVGSVGNPFASPTKIQSNIEGALGVWGGYNAIYHTIIDSL